MYKALGSVAFLLAILVQLHETSAVEGTFVATNNATVQPAGPRVGTNGTNFFNVEGSANGANSSWGVMDIPVSSFNFGGSVIGINSVTLRLVENNSAFSLAGPFSVYLTDNITTSISNAGGSPLTFTDPATSPQGTATVSPLAASPDSLFPLISLGSFNFPLTGTGTVENFSLNFAGNTLTTLINRINSNSTIRLVITPDSATTAATWTGATNGTVAQRPRLIIDSNVDVPFWDVNGSTPGVGGTGTWDTTTPNFNNSTGTGTPALFDASRAVVFAGTAPGGTVTITPGGITANGGIQFTTDGYTVQGGTLTIGTNNTVSTGSGVNTVIASKISGSNGILKQGAGTLKLSNITNDFTGDVTVGGGTLTFVSEASLGALSNNIVLSGGTLKLDVAADLALDPSRSLNGTGGGIDVGAGKVFTVQGGTNLTGTLTLPVVEIVVLAGGQKTLGGIAFAATAGGSFLKDGLGGIGTINMDGGISASNTAGVATIESNVNFGAIARPISVAASGRLNITGGISSFGPTSSRVSITGGGTLDVQGDNSNFLQPVSLGTSNAAGPTVLVHDQKGLGFNPAETMTMFFNSGTIANGTIPVATLVPGAPIIFNLADSIGATSTQPATFAGGEMEFKGPVNLFRPTTAQNGIRVNNNTTFSGGWIASTGTATNLSGVVVDGTGSLTLTAPANPLLGTVALDVPLTVTNATLNINSPMTNAGANISVGGTGTVKIGIENAVNAGSTITISNTATFNLNGFNQTVAGVRLVAGNITGVGNTLTSTTNFDVLAGSVSANLGGAVGLVKTTTGVATLSGTNSYSGTTAINGGTLTLTGSLASTSLSLGGGTLAVNNGATGASFSGGTTLTPGPAGITGTTSSAVNLGAITRNAGSTVDFTLPTAPGTIATATANSNFAGGSQTILGGYATVGGATASATWAVSGTGGTPGTISGLSTYSATFAAGSNVDAPIGPTSPGTMTVNSLRFNAAGAYAIGDSGGSTLTIATGGILVSSNVGANAVAIDVANLATGNGQDLVVHQYNTNAAGALTISSAISGTGGLTKTGGGALILSGAKTYSGNTTIGGGTLTINNSLGLQNSTLDYSYAGTLGFGALTNATLGGLKGTNSLALGALALTVGNNNSSNTYAGALSGAGAQFIKTGTGTQILTGANAYTGATTISNGILQVGDGGTTGAIPNTATSVAAGAQLVFNRSNALTFSGTLSGAGSLTQAGAGITTLSGANTYIGATSINAGSLNVGVAEVTTPTPTGPLGVGGAISFGGGALQYSTTNNFDYSSRFSTAAGQLYKVDTNNRPVTWAGNLTSSGGSLTKLGTGTLTLSGANTYNGGTTITAGTLALGSAGAIGSTGTIAFGGGTLQYTAANTTDYSARLSTADSQIYRVDPNGQAVVWASNLVSNLGGLIVSGTTGGSLALQGNNSGIVPAAGQGSVTLGTVAVGGPTLIVNNINNLPSGEFRFNGGTFQAAAAPLTFGTSTTVSIGAAGTSPTASATFAGSNLEFQGAVSLFKSGGNSSRITVNNTTTFSGGLGATTGTGADPALVVAGTGTLNIAGGGHNLPITVDTATLNLTASMNNNLTNFKVTNGGKLNGQVDNALPTGSTLTLGDTAANSGGTYSTAGNDQRLNNLIVQSSNSVIDFGGGGSILKINPSNTQTWSGLLRLNNWSGSLTGNGTDQFLVVDNGTLTGLSAPQLGEIHFTGYLTGAKLVVNGIDSEIVPSNSTQLKRGDVNQDTVVDGLDIHEMLVALNDLNLYASQHPAFDTLSLGDVLDINQDGKITNRDIQPLLNILSGGGGSLAAVPEPGSIALFGLALPALLLAYRRKKLIQR